MKDKLHQRLLHEHYVNLRKMLEAGFPKRGVQKSFEELVYSVVGKDSWRPTHISHEALNEYIEGSSRNVQRAHGVVGNRLDRYVRTMNLLETFPEMVFPAWWQYFTEHDKTVLITRKEHGSGKKFKYEELIPLPDWSDNLFENSGFSVKVRKKSEGVWLQNTYNKRRIECQS